MTAQTFAVLAPGSCSLTQPPRDFDSNPYYLRTARLSDNPVGAASAALCQVIFLIASNLARPVAYGRPAFPSATSEVRDAREAAERVAEDVAGAEPFSFEIAVNFRLYLWSTGEHLQAIETHCARSRATVVQ